MRLLPLLLAAVPLLGVAELGLHHYFAGRAPGFTDYAALAPELMKLKAPGIPVVVSPRWAEPLVRQAAPAAFPLSELTRPDDSGFAGFLEVSLGGASAPELAELPVRKSHRTGAFSLTLRDNPRAEPALFDFVGAVESGEVEVFTDVEGERHPCRLLSRAHTASGGLHGHVAYPRRRHECASGRVVGVSVIDDQDYRPRRCILAQPPERGSLVLRFAAVPGSQRLIGFAGYSYFLSRDVNAAPVELRVIQGQRELGQYRASPARGWSRFELARSPDVAAVEVSLIRLASEPSDFCFALEAR